MPSLHKELTKDDAKNSAAQRAKELINACECVVVPHNSRPFKFKDPTSPTKEELDTLTAINKIATDTVLSECLKRWPMPEAE
jgi:hypothetical protein